MLYWFGSNAFFFCKKKKNVSPQIIKSMCAQLCPTLFRPHGLQPFRLLCPWDSPGKNPGVGCHFLLQGIFPTQGSNLHLQCHFAGGLFTSDQRGRLLQKFYKTDRDEYKSHPKSYRDELKVIQRLRWQSSGQWLRLHAPSAGNRVSIPRQEATSRVLQLRSHIPQLRLGTAK